MKKTLLLFAVLFSVTTFAQQIKPGAYSVKEYIKLIDGKKVGIVANHTSEINGVSLVDTLISLNQNVVRIFSPEHGFRGTADAGEKIKNGIDEKTGLQVVSLYGKNRKPKNDQLKGIDVVVFDLQDVGARFYTYISTLHYVMEACSENNIPVIVLDRPNPNAHYVDGPMLDTTYKSFVGMHPVPTIYGMTIGEYGKMINGEGWLKNNIKADLTVIENKNYNHSMKYDLPFRPSPNLPNAQSINLYASICFFEGTPVSAGRGTEKQFQIYGAPELKGFDFEFTPQPNFGSKKPKFNGEKCFGEDLSEIEYLDELNLEWLIKAYNSYPEKDKFFNAFFVKLAGTDKLQKQIEDGMSAKKIRKSWKKDLKKFKKIRSKYLLYK
ncbi:MAG: DUF1343 domain-containing protein [Ichthyobacteriaceae bacterium]|nr:DUF1343 domain-containing protein [Ichthyobacteriaceae bacterium]